MNFFVGQGIDPLEINGNVCRSLFEYMFLVKTGSDLHICFEHTCLKVLHQPLYNCSPFRSEFISGIFFR